MIFKYNTTAIILNIAQGYNTKEAYQIYFHYLTKDDNKMRIKKNPFEILTTTLIDLDSPDYFDQIMATTLIDLDMNFKSFNRYKETKKQRNKQRKQNSPFL
jgi:hypothetical protein